MIAATARAVTPAKTRSRPYLPEGYNHAIWGAEVTLAPLNLCAETLDGVRHHSWSLPSPVTPEGVVVSWADRCAYCAHDLEDAADVGIIDLDDLPQAVTEVAGRSRASQLRCFIGALVECITETGEIGMRQPYAGALSALRDFNYERIYTRPGSIAQGETVVAVLRDLVEYFANHPEKIPAARARRRRAGWTPWPWSALTAGALAAGTAANSSTEADGVLRRAITYVSGMTDRFAFSTAVRLLGWQLDRLPAGLSTRRHHRSSGQSRHARADRARELNAYQQVAALAGGSERRFERIGSKPERAAGGPSP